MHQCEPHTQKHRRVVVCPQRRADGLYKQLFNPLLCQWTTCEFLWSSEWLPLNFSVTAKPDTFSYVPEKHPAPPTTKSLFSFDLNIYKLPCNTMSEVSTLCLQWLLLCGLLPGSQLAALRLLSHSRGLFPYVKTHTFISLKEREQCIAQLYNCETNIYLNCCFMFNSKAIQGRSCFQTTIMDLWSIPDKTKHVKESLTKRRERNPGNFLQRYLVFFHGSTMVLLIHFQKLEPYSRGNESFLQRFC